MKKERWQNCNVVSPSPTGNRLWQFRAKGDSFAIARYQAIEPDEKLPAKAVTKTFQSFWNRKLNVALLPPGNVFMGVVELPTVEPEELHGMLEFQLEKLSPLPVTQIVWTYHELPSTTEGMTRIILVIASRHEVEVLLGKLEKDGFLADRLEFPLLDELLAILGKAEDGLWLLPRRTGELLHALAAWISDGQLRNVTLFYLPEEDWETSLTNQLAQTVWSGELDGWLTGPPRCHIAADEELAATFEPVLKEFSSQDVVIDPLVSDDQLTTMTAVRAASTHPAARLLPEELSKRYHQSFVDGLWMRSLGVVILIYIFGVLLYFAGIEWAKFERTEAESNLQSISLSYTNTLQAGQRVQILQNQMNLKYAALDSFRAVAEELPEGIQLNSFNFQRGGKVSVFGTSPQNAPGKVSEFVDKLRVAEVDGRRIFSTVRAPNISSQPGTQLNRWDFVGELANPEK